MGICYMLQLMDKSTLSYATQLGILKDLVSQYPEHSSFRKRQQGKKPNLSIPVADKPRNFKVHNIVGHRQYSTLDTSFGASLVHISLCEPRWQNTLPAQ